MCIYFCRCYILCRFILANGKILIISHQLFTSLQNMQHLTLFLTSSFMYVGFTSGGRGRGKGVENTPPPSQVNFSSTSCMKLIFGQTLISTINFQKVTKKFLFAPYFLLMSTFFVIFICHILSFNFSKDSGPKLLKQYLANEKCFIIAILK